MRAWAFVLPVAVLSFALGFLTDRHGWHRQVRAAISYAAGQAGGCQWDALLRAAARAENLERMVTVAQRESRIVEKSDDGFTRWETPLGSFWCPPRNRPGYAVGEQMAAIYTEGDMAVRAGDVVIDCGANIGDFVRVCLRGGADKVVAIDPSPANVAAMERSFREEIAAGRVVIIPKGVWKEETTLKLLSYENTLLDSFVMKERWENEGKPKPREILLPVTTVDKIVRELGLNRVTFLKMDIVGAEREALRGAAETIRKFKPRMALATENLADDYLAVPAEVSRIEPKYVSVCGQCRVEGLLSYRPEILYFRIPGSTNP